MKKQHKQQRFHRILWALALTCSLIFTGVGQAATHKADFNGDGYGDLLVGVPYENVNGHIQAGAVSVVYGSHNGLPSGPRQTLHLDTLGNGEQAPIKSYARPHDEFGLSVAVGDFDDDGYDDAAIGTPYKDYLGKTDVGFVTILYGSRAYGLHGPRNEYVGIGLFNNKAQNGAKFGRALAVGDINGDHYDDLAIGIPGYDVDQLTTSPKTNAGAIAVFFGSANGLCNSHLSPHFIIQSLVAGHPDSEGPAYVKGRSEPHDQMGSVLKLADFNHDGRADLVIGIPKEDIEGTDVKTNAGGVVVLNGSPNGLVRGPGFITDGWSQTDDLFGSSLAAGDFNGDENLDLAIGAPGQDIKGNDSAGMVVIVYGSRQGLNSNHRGYHDQDRIGVNMKAEEDDWFGYALAAGDFNNDGKDDLAVGVPYEDRNKTLWFDDLSTGIVALYQGGFLGLKFFSSVHQDSEGIAGKREMSDRFGRALSVNDFDNDGKADLAIGVDGESVRDSKGSNIDNAGIVQVLYGNTRSLLAPGETQIISQSLNPYAEGAGKAENYDFFGFRLP